jgi:rubrerythrin
MSSYTSSLEQGEREGFGIVAAADDGEELTVSLWEAFNSEAGTAALYRYFSAVAKIEGFPEVSAMLQEIAESIDCLAHGHFDALRYEGDPVSGLPLGDTAQNLISAVHTATENALVRYVRMRRLARDVGLEDVVSWLDTVVALKRRHAERLSEALRSVEEQEARPAAGNADSVAALRN